MRSPRTLITGSDTGRMVCAARSRERAAPAARSPGAAGPRSEVEVAVLDAERDVLARLELAAHPVGHGHRSMPPAGTADRDGQVALALLAIGTDQEVEQRPQQVVEPLGLVALFDELADLGIEPGQWAQLVLVVRIGQEADVE